MKTCLFCQTRVEDNVSHCPACGAAIPSDSAYTSPASENPPIQTSTPPAPHSEPVPHEDPMLNDVPTTEPVHAPIEEPDADLTPPAAEEPQMPPPEPPAPEPLAQTAPAEPETSVQKPHRFKRFLAALAARRRRILALAITFAVGIATGVGSGLLASHLSKPPAVTVDALESMADQIAEQYAVLIPEEDSKTASISIEDLKTSLSGGIGKTYSYRFILKQQAVSAEMSYGELVGIDYNQDGLMDCITYTFPHSGSPNDEKMQVSHRVFAALVEKLTPFDPHQIWAPSEEEPNWDIGKTADDSADTNSRRTIRLTTDSCYLSMYYSYSGNSDMVTNLYLNPQAIFASGWLY